MNKLLAILFLTVSFSLAARLDDWFQRWSAEHGRGGGALAAVLGDSRRMFANHFFVKADAYFHSGYYPTMFDDSTAFQSAHMAADAGAIEDQNTGDEHAFLGPPLDWIDRFNRRFFPSEHTHLDEGGAHEAHTHDEHCEHDHAHEGDAHEEGHATASEAREILPWIRLSATLDPNRVESYVTAAYWLRERLDRPVEAEQFLREGLRNNPESHEILFELGRIAHESKHNNRLARVMWERSLAMWMKHESTREEPDLFFLRQIVTYLGHMEAEDGDYARALEVFNIGATVGQRPDLYADDIAAAQARLAAQNADQTSR